MNYKGLIKQIEINVIGDSDVYDYAERVGKVLTYLFDSSEVTQGEDELSFEFIRNFILVHDEMPNGSRADYISGHVAKEIQGITIRKVPNELIDQTIESAHGVLNPYYLEDFLSIMEQMRES